jgi:hypothetical protein
MLMDLSLAASTGADTVGRVGGKLTVEAVSMGGEILAPGMQYDRDNSSDGCDQDCSGNSDASVGEVFWRLGCLKKLQMAVPARRYLEIRGSSALRTLFLHHVASSVAGGIPPQLSK